MMHPQEERKAMLVKRGAKSLGKLTHETSSLALQKGTDQTTPPKMGTVAGTGITSNKLYSYMLIIAAVFSCAFLLRSVSPLASSSGYIVVIDAGSSGSRAHVFHASGGLVDPKHESLKTKPGLSSYATVPSDAGRSLEPLMEFARKYVPESEIKNTKIILKATAGMRLLQKNEREAILKDVRTYLSKTGFAFSKKDAEVIDGKEEGLLGWLAINYLNNEPGTWGVLEMGGASVQVTLKVNNEDKSNVVPNEHKRPYHNPTSGKPGEVFTHSFLGLGMTSAREAVNEVLTKSGASKDPCLQTGFVVGAESSALSGVTTAIPEGDFDACSKLISETLYVASTKECSYPNGCLYDGMYAPKFGKIWAFENFFYAPSALGMDGVPGVIAAKDLAKAAKQNCAMGWKEMDAAYPKDDQPHELNENWCFGMTHLHSFLIHGLGISPEQQITISNNVGENGIDWALGAALQTMKSKSGGLRSQA
ncbi:MAG: hypothetical protein OSA78_09805 [Flavobacteriales bacterium]|nr:hypothetical protein [Flavobacteriales bacterium]